MLGQRRRRWANIGQTLGRCVVFAGISLLLTVLSCNRGKPKNNNLYFTSQQLLPFGFEEQCTGKEVQMEVLRGGDLMLRRSLANQQTRHIGLVLF